MPFTTRRRPQGPAGLRSNPHPVLPMGFLRISGDESWLRPDCLRSLYGQGLRAESRDPRAAWVVRTPTPPREALLLTPFLGQWPVILSSWTTHRMVDRSQWSLAHLSAYQASPLQVWTPSLRIKCVGLLQDAGIPCLPQGQEVVHRGASGLGRSQVQGEII